MDFMEQVNQFKTFHHQLSKKLGQYYAEDANQMTSSM